MNFLDAPSHPVRPPVVIPFLCADIVDEGDWLGYPQRAGIQPDEQLNSSFWASRLPQLQYWLFFAPIIPFCGARFSKCESYLVDDTDGEGVVDLSELGSLLEVLAETFDILPAELKERFRIAWENKITTWIVYSGRIVPQNEEMGIICFSIAVLIERVALTLDPIIGKDIWSQITYIYPPQTPGPHSYPWNKMLEGGWCPSHLRSLKDLRPAALYYSSLLERPDLNVSHEVCTDARCHVPSIQSPKHVVADCTCPLLTADQKLMCGILKAGSFPLIRMDAGESGDQPSLKVVQHKPFMRFIALSHVWADGLGNPKSNSLPTCQLLRLTKLLDEAYTTKTYKTMFDEMGEAFKQVTMEASTAVIDPGTKMYFWCDTICCPTNDTVAHTLSLSIMPETYSKAEKVVVLDSFFRSCRSIARGADDAETVTHSEMLERAMRVRCSRWTQRLWTLQEAALAQELWFYFDDGLFEMDLMMSDVPEHMIGGLRKMLRCMGTNEAHSGNIELEEHVDQAGISEVHDNFNAAWGEDGITRYLTWTRDLDDARERTMNAAFVYVTLPEHSDEARQELEAARQELERLEQRISDRHQNNLSIFSEWSSRLERAENEMAEHEKYFRLQARVCQAVSARRATVQSDEAICLAALLKLDIKAIAETRPEDRMHKFWGLQSAYCNSLIEYVGPKLSVPGFRWAPSTLMNQSYSIPRLFDPYKSYSSQPAELTSAGLVVSFPGLITQGFVSDTVSIQSNGYFWDPEVNRIIATTPYEGCEQVLRIPDSIELPTLVGFIFLRDTNPKGGVPNKDDDICKAVVVFIEGTKDGVFNVIRGDQVLFSAVEPGDPDWDHCYEVVSLTANQQIESSFHALTCGLWPPDQKWCILE